ncbi:MAG: LUD domain-containing protein [Lentisphaeria bacterium]|nr:LUD domain-containing protein [Lentisphaeria bacterium]
MGVDAIIGSHPHVIQPMETLSSTTDPDHKTVCFYSLGNFLSNQNRETLPSYGNRIYTENGLMVNIDGNCNRIAAIAFGPRSVILIVGMNKICRDLPAARHRAQSYVAPANGIRLGVELPCTKTGFCHDCHAENSMCAQIVEMRRNRIAHRIKVLLTPFALGI